MKDIFSSRKFWALIIALCVLFASFFFPNFTLNEEATIGLVVIVASYILGVAVDPGASGWHGVVKSRKFWGATIGLVAIVLNGFGIKLPVEVPQDTLIWVCVTIGAYISGVALEAKRLLPK
jgi:hypothetical protein